MDAGQNLLVHLLAKNLINTYEEHAYEEQNFLFNDLINFRCKKYLLQNHNTCPRASITYPDYF